MSKLDVRVIPLELLDPSPFEPREVIAPLDDTEVISPVVVRLKPGGRFEIITGHRRVATLLRDKATEAPCRVLEIDEETAATLLYRENESSVKFTDYERGVFYKKYMGTFRVTQSELARRMGVSETMVSMRLSVVEARAHMSEKFVPTNQPSLYERVVTTNKIKEVKGLPREKQSLALQAVVENQLSTEETRMLVSKIETGATPEAAANHVVLQREARKAQNFADRKRREACPTCGGRGWVLKAGEAS